MGQHEGSRVLIAMPGADGYDGSGGNPQIGVKMGDTLVFVVDIVAVPLEGPEGTEKDAKAGLPTVTDKDGVPEITIPKTDPPAELQAETLIEGKGKKVAESDAITMNYRWVRWSDGKVLEETYGKAPAEVPLVQPGSRGGQGLDRKDGRQPGAAGHPAVRKLSRRQPDALDLADRDHGDGRRRPLRRQSVIQQVH